MRESITYRFVLIIASLMLCGLMGVNTHAQAQNAYIDGLTEALESASAKGDLGARRDILKDLSRSYYEAGDYELAYTNHLLYSNAKDSVFNNAKSVKVGRLEAKFEKNLVLEEEQFRKEEETKRLEGEVRRRDNLQQFGILIFQRL